MNHLGLKEKLFPIFERYPEVAVVYLFGSKARREAGPMSDYDFAFYLNENDVVKRSQILFKISGEISKILGTDAIDAHCLNDIYSPELKYNIIKDGEVFFEREPHRVLIEPRILNEYFDFLFLLRKYNLTKV